MAAQLPQVPFTFDSGFPKSFKNDDDDWEDEEDEVSPSSTANPCCIPKNIRAYHMIRDNPEMWFGDTVIDDRDRALLSAEPVSFLELSQSSYVRKIYHMKAGEQFETTEWTVEKDIECKTMVSSAGGNLYGYPFTHAGAVHWASISVQVNIQGVHGAGFNWGFMAGVPDKIRIFKGPTSTCPKHPWDAMILRDCTTNTFNLNGIKHIASRKWDILAMKMCEDYDHPWVVVAMRDAGRYEPSTGSCSCQDPKECGCILLPH